MLLESLFTFACSKKIIASIIFTIEVNSEQVRNVMKIRKPKTTVEMVLFYQNTTAKGYGVKVVN